MARLREHLQEGILKLARSRHTEVYVKAGLLALSVILSIYLFVLVTSVHRGVLYSNTSLLKTSQVQSELYRLSSIRITNLKTELATTQALYNQSQEMLQAVSSELGATKMVLSDTERMLDEARLEIASVKTKMLQMQDKYTRDIAALEDKNIQLTQELDALKVKIDYYEGNVRDMTQAREWVQMYKSRLKLVKSRVSYFKKQAQDVRKAAQKERDHVRTILGNNGYLVRDGKVVNVDVEKYNAVGADALKTSSETPSQTSSPKARVDVQVFR